MARINRFLAETCWVLGLLSLLAGVVLKLVPTWAEMLNTAPRGGLILASSLFLCALATREIERSNRPVA
jgi:hypothetical protein